jgi:hypothetical protein
MTAPAAAPVAAPLTRAQRAVIAEALSDAISYRAPDTCRDCARGASCGDHAEDVRRRAAYWSLAAELDLEVSL